MIRSFKGKLTQAIFDGAITKDTRQFPPQIRSAAERKLDMLDTATDLADLSFIPGNRLEALRGNLKGYYSIRINDQWRILFQWVHDEPHNVQITDYH